MTQSGKENRNLTAGQMAFVEQELMKLDIDLLRGAKIAVMGRLEHVREMIASLGRMGMTVSAVFDNDPNKVGTNLGIISICAPEKAEYFRSDSSTTVRVIIYSPKYWEEMKEQLANLGYIDHEEIIVLNRPSLDGNIRMVVDGLELYQTIQDEYEKEMQIFLADCPLGDFFLLGTFLKKYCEKEGIDGYVVVGTSLGIDKLSPWLGIEHVKRLSVEESTSLIRAWMFLGKEILITPLTVWQGIFRFNPPVARQKLPFSFMDTFRSLIFNLPLDTNPELPKRSSSKDEIAEIFSQNGLQRGRTVLLSPKSYSIPSPPEEFWLRLEKEIIKRNYSVAVNIGEEREGNIFSSAIPIKLDFNRVMDFMEMAGTVIGMRSGFFDITSQARCRRIVLYPRKAEGMVQWNSTDASFCSLGAMGLCDDETEIEITDHEQTIMEIAGHLP